MATNKKSKTKSTEPVLYYFFTQGCGFCKKVDPIVDELIKEGHNILKLDLAEGDNQKLQQEIKTEYKIQCGTPWFVNAETGHNVCGFREKDILLKWVNGEDIPEPPRPKSPPPPPPKNFDDKIEVGEWKDAYKKWSKENSHLPNLPKVDDMLERLKKQSEMMKQRQQQAGQADERISRIEQKLDSLIKHLGVPQGPTVQSIQPNIVQQPQVKETKKGK